MSDTPPEVVVEMAQAAAEIRRLLHVVGEIDRLRAEVQVVTDEWVAARDEIKRLQAINAELVAAMEALMGSDGEAAWLQAEAAIAKSKGETL